MQSPVDTHAPQHESIDSSPPRHHTKSLIAPEPRAVLARACALLHPHKNGHSTFGDAAYGGYAEVIA